MSMRLWMYKVVVFKLYRPHLCKGLWAWDTIIVERRTTVFFSTKMRTRQFTCNLNCYINILWTRRLSTRIVEISIDPKPGKLKENIALKFAHLKVNTTTCKYILIPVIHSFNRPFPIYKNSNVAPRLGGIKQKKLIIQPWASLLFLLFCSPMPRSQVRILIYRKWSIEKSIYWVDLILFSGGYWGQETLRVLEWRWRKKVSIK